MDSPYIKLNLLISSINMVLKYIKNFIYIETIFNLDLIKVYFKNKLKIVKSDVFNKINFFLFIIL